MIVEIYENTTTSLMYYGTEEEPIAHLPFNFRFIFDGELNGDIIRGIVRPWLEALPLWNPNTNWVVSAFNLCMYCTVVIVWSKTCIFTRILPRLTHF